MRSALFLAALLILAGCAADPAVVETTQGRIAGVASDKVDGILSWRGIPYAAPPTGDLRWHSPLPAESWSGVRDGGAFGSRCLQTNAFPDMIWQSSAESEDCLYLNVWAPAEAEALPVLFWIHGGGYFSGSGDETRHDGSALASRDAVVVTINYRLGVWGFLAHPALSADAEHGSSGNYGLEDMVAALEWVQENITAFGGDPDRVTIFGESAGSAAVSAMMASPLTDGLFSGAIGQSGGHLAPGTLGLAPLAAAESVGAGVLSGPADSLRALPVEVVRQRVAGPRWFTVNVDQHVLPRDPRVVFESGEQQDVPLMAGWTSAEQKWQNQDLAGLQEELQNRFGERAEEAGALYPARDDAQARQAFVRLSSDMWVVYPTWKWIELHHETAESPVYRYIFDQVMATPDGPVPEDDPGAGHASDIAFVFGTLETTGNPISPADSTAAAAMMDYWVSFARDGDPNADGWADWPAWGANQRNRLMQLDGTPTSIPETDRGRFLFLDGHYDRLAAAE